MYLWREQNDRLQLVGSLDTRFAKHERSEEPDPGRYFTQGPQCWFSRETADLFEDYTLLGIQRNSTMLLSVGCTCILKIFLCKFHVCYLRANNTI